MFNGREDDRYNIYIIQWKNACLYYAPLLSYSIMCLEEIGEELLYRQSNGFLSDSDIVVWENNQKGTAFRDDPNQRHV